MTPEESAVIEAARGWFDAETIGQQEDASVALQDAIVALDAAQRSSEPYCYNCDYVLHKCPGCGVDVPHGTVACDGCNGQDDASPPWAPKESVFAAAMRPEPAAAGAPLPKAWDADRPGCAPETCGGSNLDPCSAVMRTEGAVHDDDDLGGALDRTWREIAEGDWVRGSDNSWYRVLRVAEGGGPNAGRTVVTMRIGGEARPYPMSPEGDVLVKRGPAGIAVERLRAAGLSPEALR